MKTFNSDGIQCLEEPASGEFGVIAKGIIIATREKIAIKMLITESVESIEKFKQEATVFNYLSHNDVVKMIGVQFQSAPYMIMEFMANGDLKSYMTSNADSL